MSAPPSTTWIGERLERLSTDDPAAHAEIVRLYPEAVGLLARRWEDLTADQQAARLQLNDELVEATGW